MPRTLLGLLLCATTLGAPATANAISVAAGADGRAVMAWPSAGAGIDFAERSADGRFTAPATIATPKAFPAFIATGPGDAATLLAYDNNAPFGLLLVQRTANGFEAPVPFAAGQAARVVSGASTARGDAAVLLKGAGNLTLLTSSRGAPLARRRMSAR